MPPGMIPLSAIYSSQMRCRCWMRRTSSRAVFDNRARCHLLPAAGFFHDRSARLDKANGSNFLTLLAFSGLKDDPLPLLQGAEPRTAQGGGVDENILLTVVGRYEAEPLFRIVPFDCAFGLQRPIAPIRSTVELAHRSGCFRTLILDVEDFDDLPPARSIFHRDLQLRPLSKVCAASRFDDPNVQVRLGAIRQFHEPETLGGVEPEHFGVENIWNSGWRVLKVARLSGWLEKTIIRGIAPTFSASLAMISVLAHDVLAPVESAHHLPKDNLRRARRQCQTTICSQHDGR